MNLTELNQRELNLLIRGIYNSFSDAQLEAAPESVSAKLLEKLHDAKKALAKNS